MVDRGVDLLEHRRWDGINQVTFSTADSFSRDAISIDADRGSIAYSITA